MEVIWFLKFLCLCEQIFTSSRRHVTTRLGSPLFKVTLDPNRPCPSATQLDSHPAEGAAETSKKKNGVTWIHKTSLIITSEHLDVKRYFSLCADVMCRHRCNVCTRNAYFCDWNVGLTQQNGEKLLIFMNSRQWHYLPHTHTHTHSSYQPSCLTHTQPQKPRETRQ